MRSRLADAVENLGESEVREALLAKAAFYVKIGNQARTQGLKRIIPV